MTSQPPPNGEWPPSNDGSSGPPPGEQPPYGQPGQPSYGQQPNQPQYGQQPGQPAYGQPPYGQQPPGQPPYGQPYGQPSPPPRRSRVPLIIGIVVAVVVILGGGLIALGALTGDDDGGDSDDGFQASSETVEGNGYSYPLPEDWYDLTDDLGAEQTAAGIDTFIGEENDVEQPQSNVLVEVDELPTEMDLESLRDQWQQNIASGLTGSEPEELDDITIDGEDAIGVRSEGTNSKDIDVTQEAYLSIVDQKAYTIAISYETDDADDFDGYLTDLLDEWTWK